MKTHDFILGMLFLVTILLSFITHSTNLVPEDQRILAQNFIYLLAPLLATYLGVNASRKFGWRSSHGKSIAFITAGMGLWLIGEIMWLYYDSILKVTPYPSLADAVFLIGNIFLIMGIFMGVRANILVWRSKGFFASFLFTSILLGVTIYYGLFTAYGADKSAIENAISILYGIGDIILIASSLILFNISLEMGDGRLARPWLMISAAFFIGWIADLLAYFIFVEEYMSMDWGYRQINYLWIGMYLLIGYALKKQADALDDVNAMIEENSFKLKVAKKKK